MLRSLAWLVMLGLLTPAAPAVAQPRRDPGARRAPERREQVKAKIRALRAYTLTEQLALDEQTSSRLFPALARYDDETDRLLQKRVELQRKLRRADTMRDARAIEHLIDDAIANQRGFWDLEDRRIAELRKILTPAQAAKLLVVLPALERRIQRQLRKAIARQPGAAGRRDPDDDDDLEDDEAGPRREAPLPPRPRENLSNAPGNTPPR
jgi:hypothetical protein